MRGLLFNGVFALHIQLSCHLVAIVSLKITVQRLVVSCYTAPYSCCVGSKKCCYFGHIVLQNQCCKACLPFVCVEYDVLGVAQIETIIAFYHLCSCQREHRRVVVIAISVQTVYAIVLPKFTVKFILAGIKRLEIHQKCYRAARNVPSSHPQSQAFTVCNCHPFLKKFLVFRKERVLRSITTVGTNKHNVVSHLLL